MFRKTDERRDDRRKNLEGFGEIYKAGGGALVSQRLSRDVWFHVRLVVIGTKLKACLLSDLTSKAWNGNLPTSHV
jgi:hypothetical protein